MSKILNEAVYLLNPAGSTISYKEDTLYSVLPNDGTGDYTWVGGDGGTRVNQDGYIERTPANLHLKSNEFNQSPWSKTGGTTLTSGQSDPFGGNNAWKVEMTSGANNFLYAYSNPRVLGIVTISAYLRADTTTTIGFNDGAANPNSATIGTTWQRYTFTYDVATAGPYSIIQFDNYFGVSPTQQNITFYLYGAQLVEGSIPKPYQPTTDRLNYPRIDFSKGKGALLLEKGNTNHVLDSQDLTKGTWSKNATSITIPGDVMSPDGTLNANKVTRGGTSSTYFYSPNTQTTSDRFNSLFWKAGTLSQVTYLGNSYNSGTYATFDLRTGKIVASAGCTPFMIPYKNGWYRCGAKQTNGVNYSNLWTLNGYTNQTVVSGEYAYAWGGQSERVVNNTRVLPSSYIPTGGSSVTRVSDDGYTTSTSNLPTGASPRTLFTEFEYDGVEDTGDLNGSYNWISGYGNQTTGGLFSYIISSGNNPYFFGYSDDSHFTGTTLQKNKRYRWAATFNGTTVDFFVNGSSIGTYTPTLNTTNQSLYQNQRPDGNFNSQKLIFTEAVIPRQLSTTEAQSLTSFKSGSGGEVTNYGPYTIHTFTGSATFSPSFTGEVEVLVVAGGGAGGAGGSNVSGAGGGAGGLMYNSSIPVTSGTNYTIVVGAGGAGTTPTSDAVGDPGTPSSAFGLNTTGGGGGEGNSSANNIKQRGGSGGGGRESDGTGGTTIDTQQGNIGGDGSEAGNYAGGGGGAGQPGNTNGLGYGGDGLSYPISGYPTYYAGGGSSIGPPGSAESAEPGLGGGGKGRYGRGGDDGVANTGGGGGGTQSAYASGNGGSGIVIIRYLT